VRALLAAAARAVPADTTHAAAAADTSHRRPAKPHPTWRPAGPRGAEGTDAATVLYWMH